MKLRPGPRAATWFLKLFCPNIEHDSVLGDLTEQFQQGHGSVWYWRQVVNIVFLRLYRKPGIPVRHGMVLLLLIAALSSLLLSDIWVLFMIPILGGVITGLLKFGLDNGPAGSAQAGAPAVVRIDSSKIPISGGAGAGVLIVILFCGVLHDLPMLRLLAAPGIFAGLFFAGVLRLWARLHVPAPPLMTLGLSGSAIRDVKHER